MVTYREFKIGDLFDGASGDTDLKKEHLNGEGYPVITAGVDNLGVAGYSSVNAKILPANSLTVDMFGNCYFRPFEYKMVTHSRVFALTLKNRPLTSEMGLFICTALKWLQSKFNYSNMCTYNKIKNKIIKLPVKPRTDETAYTEEDIDWDYMESYIHELEQSYIHELDAYLKETGLDDYELTDAEREVLEREPMLREFKVGDLFDKLNLKRIKTTFNKRSDLSKVPTEEFDLPLVNAKAGNNGIMYYGRSGDWESDTMTIDIVSNGAVSTGMVYAQPQATGVLWDAYLIKLKSDILSDVIVEHLLFLATTIQKSIQLKFNYSNKAVWAKVQNESIQLPVKPGTDEVNYTEDDIDWNYMESYIRVMEKQVIADVVDYKESAIKTAKELVYV